MNSFAMPPSRWTLVKRPRLALILAMLFAIPSLSMWAPAYAQTVVVGPNGVPIAGPPSTAPKRGISLHGFSIPLGLLKNTESLRDRDVTETLPGQVLFTTDADPAAIAAQAGLDLIEAIPLQSLGTTLVVAGLRKRDSLEAALQRLTQSADVHGPQPNFIFQTMSDAEPAPKRFAIHGLGAPTQVNANTSATARTIAMIDTSVALDHEALRGARLEQRLFIADATPKAHGTAVASLIAGSGSEVPGVARGARLLSFAAFTERKDGVAVATTTNLAKALDAAAIARPDVLNLAFGGREDPLLGLMVDEIDRRGVCVVAASGNGGARRRVPFPASHPAVLAVTAIDNALKPYEHASRGDRIDVAAVGVDVFVAVPDGTRSAYRRMSGTSMASALVAGALLRATECEGARAPTAIRPTARAAARDLGSPGHDPIFGAGLFLLPQEKSRSH
ncbi:S8 family serine peptidase [Lysobacter sp. Root916]|uniref:S8 family serine peptidase n=1 Tax=Lysobacter sp. Root916 TaxID=1736606 RepID=UPI0009EB6B80|nr:S8 family serine peptidase [Lysobacter sp. Root916]